jgi:hypothetical protein
MKMIQSVLDYPGFSEQISMTPGFVEDILVL